MNNSSITNKNQNSCTNVTLGCDYMWSFAQKFAYNRISNKLPSKLTNRYSNRARRIAATYARFYLEIEEGGKPHLKGRYYWMGLGAFASKTVACSLDDPRVNQLQPVFDGLCKGNLWLFMDIAPWHWYRSNYTSSFDACKEERGKNCHVPEVEQILQNIRWAKEALPKINYFYINDNIREGMDLINKFEKSPVQQRPDIQLEHLLAIAKHEQGNVLQPLIYDDPTFSSLVKVQRWPLVKDIAPDLKIVFAHTCNLKSKDPLLQSFAPEDTILEDFNSRMKWITNVAKQFHGLMQGDRQDSDIEYMEQELATMAKWVE